MIPTPDEKEAIVFMPKEAPPVEIRIGIDKRLLREAVTEGAGDGKETGTGIFRTIISYLIGFVLGVVTAYLYWIY